MMDVMAEDLNLEGEYACFVGHLTSTTHNEWVDAEIAQQQEKYPNIEIGNRSDRRTGKPTNCL